MHTSFNIWTRKNDISFKSNYIKALIWRKNTYERCLIKQRLIISSPPPCLCLFISLIFSPTKHPLLVCCKWLYVYLFEMYFCLLVWMYLYLLIQSISTLIWLLLLQSYRGATLKGLLLQSNKLSENIYGNKILPYFDVTKNTYFSINISMLLLLPECNASKFWPLYTY